MLNVHYNKENISFGNINQTSLLSIIKDLSVIILVFFKCNPLYEGIIQVSFVVVCCRDLRHKNKLYLIQRYKKDKSFKDEQKRQLIDKVVLWL